MPPVAGGSFHFPKMLLPEFPFVLEFTELKLKTAYIIEALQQASFVSQVIAPSCVQTEQEQFLSATYKYQTRKIPTQRYKKYRFLKKRGHILFEIMCSNKFTIVTHPLGMHKDVFGSMYTHSMERSSNGHEFTWALLDWSSRTSGRCHCIDIQLGRDPNVIVCADVWQNWLEEDNY